MSTNAIKNKIHPIIILLLLATQLSSQGMPPEYEFMKAVHSGKVDAAQKSLATGIDVNSKTPNGMSAGHIAADACNVPMLKFLVAQGLNTGALDARGRTPLAVALGKYSPLMG